MQSSPSNKTTSIRLPTNLGVKDVRWESINLSLGQSLRNHFSHDIAESQQSFVIEIRGPSVGERNEASGRDLTDEKARRQMRWSASTSKLKLRVRCIARVSEIKVCLLVFVALFVFIF